VSVEQPRKLGRDVLPAPRRPRHEGHFRHVGAHRDRNAAERHHAFGNEVNLACKLGEDRAQRQEILLTRAAHEALPSGFYRFSPRRYAISGFEIEAFRFEERLAKRAT